MGMVRCKWTRHDEEYGIDHETECGVLWPNIIVYYGDGRRNHDTTQQI